MGDGPDVDQKMGRAVIIREEHSLRDYMQLSSFSLDHLQDQSSWPEIRGNGWRRLNPIDSGNKASAAPGVPTETERAFISVVQWNSNPQAPSLTSQLDGD